MIYLKSWSCWYVLRKSTHWNWILYIFAHPKKCLKFCLSYVESICKHVVSVWRKWNYVALNFTPKIERCRCVTSIKGHEMKRKHWHSQQVNAAATNNRTKPAIDITRTGLRNFFEYFLCAFFGKKLWTFFLFVGQRGLLGTANSSFFPLNYTKISLQLTFDAFPGYAEKRSVIDSHQRKFSLDVQNRSMIKLKLRRIFFNKHICCHSNYLWYEIA